MIGEETYEHVHAAVETRLLDRVIVKEKSPPTTHPA
jgi:hypothetical protein